MVELFHSELKANEYQSSKGNQLKWKNNNIWYKADYAGYEGLAEYMVSHLLQFSSLKESEYVLYETEEIRYKNAVYRGCRSNDFLGSNRQLITLERLFRQQYGRSLYESVFRIPDIEDRILFLAEQVKRMTGVSDFESYLSKLLTIDAVFLNEDRHMHNIAVILNEDKKYIPAPVFDQGASLLSDTMMDYPLGGNIYDQIDEVNAKTVSMSFDEQLDTVESLFGSNITFTFGKKQVEELLDKEPYYPEDIKRRVRDVIFDRMRKYSYLWI